MKADPASSPAAPESGLSSAKWEAVAGGHICLDVIPGLAHLPAGSFAQVFQPGRLIDAGPVWFSTGGSVSNTGLVMNKLGVHTALMGKIGDDLFGAAIRQIVAAFGSDLAGGMIVDPKVASSYTVVINPPGVDRIFLHCPGANDTFTADDVRYDALAQARLFHFGYPPLMKQFYIEEGVQLTDLLRRAKLTGVTTSLDMALPDPTSPAGRANWPAIVRNTLPYADIFLPSIEEILYMIRRETYDELRRRAGGPQILPLVTADLLLDLSAELIDLGAKIVGIKLGECGLFLRTAGRAALEKLGRARPDSLDGWTERVLWSPCFQVEVVGTTGAGDSTIAGFLCALLRGLPAEEALNMAVAVGACNVEAADALSGVRTWDDTRRRIQAGWRKRALAVEGPRWVFEENRQMWVRA
ncbi:MAG: PfkB family carbohydrate kinase [Anaerolineae bacterium]|nr:PfkB family carbohydrate kinase [Thermoflexales bacterium]MDW8406900.1 PfkB family carbohydrate kinase [Anaerolineae bacterium]